MKVAGSSWENSTDVLTRITNDGERMITGNSWGYWAHLSIYHFALPWVKGLHVLEAGTGAGYGADYFMQRGAASVLGFDASADAVSYSQGRYTTPGLKYDVADLNKGLPIESKKFDVVFSSNVFEHVALIDTLIADCARVIKDDGAVIVAVPHINTEFALEVDVRNQFHVHHFPPSAWWAKLNRFFEEVVSYRHLGAGEYASDKREQEELLLPADRVTIRETDFEFPECRADELDGLSSITAVYVCRRPRSVALPETIAERTPARWAEGAVAARIIREGMEQLAALKREHEELSAQWSEKLSDVQNELSERERLLDSMRSQIAHCRAELSALRSSTSWRVTAPLRSVASIFRRG